jgi:hypothetical protein
MKDKRPAMENSTNITLDKFGPMGPTYKNPLPLATPRGGHF